MTGLEHRTSTVENLQYRGCCRQRFGAGAGYLERQLERLGKDVEELRRRSNGLDGFMDGSYVNCCACSAVSDLCTGGTASGEFHQSEEGTVRSLCCCTVGREYSEFLGVRYWCLRMYMLVDLVVSKCT